MTPHEHAVYQQYLRDLHSMTLPDAMERVRAANPLLHWKLNQIHTSNMKAAKRFANNMFLVPWAPFVPGFVQPYVPPVFP
uniref:Phospholipase n=1 Tax=Steinernema glaseri TaxID=37863 RepID=A0A1I8ANP7_9BILA